MTSHDDIAILFYPSADPELHLSATIIDRDNEMVIDIPRSGDDGPYLVKGHWRKEGYWAGRDSADAEPVDVVARWALLGDVYVGIWIEDGEEFLFRFSLGKTRRRS